MARRARNLTVEPQRADEPARCWLCDRALGCKVEWHHVVPKSRGGSQTAAVHPICHRTIHAYFSNTELARMAAQTMPLAKQPEMARFLAWIANKPPDFRAPTRRRK